MTRGAHPARAGLPTAAVLLLIYAATLARGVTWWDAGEFLAAVHALGIPHPPGTPVYVLVAHVWAMLLAPATGYAIAVNLLSAASSAAACGIVAALVGEWLTSSTAGVAAGLCAGVTCTLWLNATETEVYATTLLLSVMILWVAEQGRRTRDTRWVLLAAYLAGLGWALHLTALLTVPAALVLAAPVVARLRLRSWGRGAALALLGATPVLYLLLRARHDPAVNQGDPATLPALWAVLTRAQYDVAPLWPRRAPLWLQLGNVFEYADWQFALGLHPDPPPALARTAVTLAYAALGVAGCVWHRRQHRASWRAWLTLLVTGSLGVALYLNLRAGPSYGVGIVPHSAPREARERDYFFTWAWLAWGAWAGIGALVGARTIAARIQAGTARRALQVSTAPGTARAVALVGTLAIALLPAVLNWPVVWQARRTEAREAAAAGPALLAPLPPRAVFLTVGDNDTYPLWYAQQVLGVRRDVVVVPVPLVVTRWYRAELRRRYGLLGARSVDAWRGIAPTLDELARRAVARGRPVARSRMTGAMPLP